MKIKSILMIIMTPLLMGHIDAHAADTPTPRRIVIFPFQIVSTGQTDVLQNGIDTLLRNRFSGGQCQIVFADRKKEPPISQTAEAVTAAIKLNGDYAIYGSVVKFGDVVTTDGFMINVQTKSHITHYHNTGTGDGAIVSQLSAFSDQAMGHLSTTCYPDVVLKEPPRSSDAKFNPNNPQFQWKSQVFDGRINGLAVSDLNGDGQLEIVIAFDSRISINAWENGTMKERASIAFPSSQTIAGVDTADLNKNGFPEIFISIIGSDSQSISSSIVEWNGKGYSQIKSGLKWIFRSTAQKTAILCQKNDSLNAMLGSQIHYFGYANGTYAPAEPLPVPKGSNLYGLAVSGEKKGALTAYYDSDNKIKVFDTSRTLIWESGDQFGGGAVFMAKRDETDRDMINRIFLEPRIRFIDLSNDRKEELVTIKNSESTRHLFTGIKSYKSGQIIIFSSNITGYSPAYSSISVPGYISDFAVNDMNGDNHADLVYPVVTTIGTILGKQKSYILMQSIDR